MTLKSDAKSEEKLTCGLENDMGLKFTEELCMITMKNDAILKEN